MSQRPMRVAIASPGRILPESDDRLDLLQECLSSHPEASSMFVYRLRKIMAKIPSEELSPGALYERLQEACREDIIYRNSLSPEEAKALFDKETDESWEQMLKDGNDAT